MKRFLFALLGLGCGVISVLFVLKYVAKFSPQTKRLLTPLGIQKPAVIGFFPYWLMSAADRDYSPYIDTISYFALTVGIDGTLEKRTKPTETEPGWRALSSNKMGAVLATAKKNNMGRSLVIFSGDQEKIGELIAYPNNHAQALMNEVSPIISKYGFTDLNIDIEKVSLASSSARQNFTQLIKTIHQQLRANNSNVTLSIDVSPTALIQPYLTDISAIAPYVDTVIFMVYDFHFQGSSVTGAVSPVGGAGVTAEYDAETSIKEALKVLPPEKIILGVPLYGYEWETLADHPHAAVIPGSGITASSRRIEDFLTNCASCSAQFDPVSKESYLIYKDQNTNTYHQLFYPDKQAMQEKVNLVKKYHLGGMALWALGYEGNAIFDPLKNL